MKKYMAPEMETLNFGVEEAIAGFDFSGLTSNMFNDDEFAW